MPKPFKACIKKGGKVVTKSLGKDRYIKICYFNSKSYPGEVKKSKRFKKTGG